MYKFARKSSNFQPPDLSADSHIGDGTPSLFPHSAPRSVPKSLHSSPSPAPKWIDATAALLSTTGPVHHEVLLNKFTKTPIQGNRADMTT